MPIQVVSVENCVLPLDNVNDYAQQETKSIVPVEEFEDYLDHVCAPLVGSVPYSERVAIRSKLRDRMSEAAAAHRELGSTDIEATELTLAYFVGNEDLSRNEICRHFPHHYTHSTSGSQTSSLSERLFGSASRSTKIAGLAFGLPMSALFVFECIQMHGTNSETNLAGARFCLTALPLLCGLITGFIAKRRSVRGVVNAIAIMTIPTIAVPGFVVCLDVTRIKPNLFDDALGYALSGVMGLAASLLFGSFGASIGQRLRTRWSRAVTTSSRYLRTH